MNTEMTQEIYVALLNEGTAVWRPVEAIVVGDGLYRIVSKNPNPDDEQWEFTTGDIVQCITKSLSGGSRLVAVEKVG
jgi:hypothetical protein